jgi:hypothetical protein
MMREIPAPGFTIISGKRNPPASWGERLWCQLRTGWVDEFAPWPVKTTRWVHDGSAGDVVAVKRED